MSKPSPGAVEAARSSVKCQVGAIEKVFDIRPSETSSAELIKQMAAVIEEVAVRPEVQRVAEPLAEALKWYMRCAAGQTENPAGELIADGGQRARAALAAYRGERE